MFFVGWGRRFRYARLSHSVRSPGTPPPALPEPSSTRASTDDRLIKPLHLPFLTLFCLFCPLLSSLFSYKYKLPHLQLFCFDNDANCRGGGGGRVRRRESEHPTKDASPERSEGSLWG